MKHAMMKVAVAVEACTWACMHLVLQAERVHQASEPASQLQSIRVRAQVRPLPTQLLTLGRKSKRQHLTNYNKKGNVPDHNRLKLSFCMNPPGRSWIKR